MIDRLTPTKRPDRTPAGYQSWRDLLFMHWAVPAEVLRPLVPAALEIDQYDGQAYLGVVPFSMHSVRPTWAPAKLGFNFLEINVRTYVTYGSEPGVYFFSLDAASRIGVWAARTFWGLPYYYATMQMDRQADIIQYQTERSGTGARHEVIYRVGEPLGPFQPDTLEFFFLERYLLFLEHRSKLYRGQVHHTPYPVRLAEVQELHDNLLAASGFDDVEAWPAYAHYSPGVDVEIFGLEQVK